MAIDKSLRWQYGNAEREVDPFSKGFETIAGKGADIKDTTKKETDTLTSGLVAKAGDIDFENIAKQALFNKVAPVALSKLGLGFLNPFVGILSALFSSKYGAKLQGFLPGLEPGQTQEAWEANRALTSLENRRKKMLDRKLKGDPYSDIQLGKVTREIAKRKGLDINNPNEMKNIDKKAVTPINIHEGEETTSTPTVTGPTASPSQMALDAAKKAAKKAADEEALTTQEEYRTGQGDDASQTGSQQAAAAHEATGAWSCFIAGTKISMADGTNKNIEDIVVGDKVKGQDGNNKVTALDPTLLKDRKLYSFNDTEHYFFTSEHPFMTEEGWKSIKPEKTKERDGVELYDQLKGELKVGDKLVTENGPVEITDIKSKEMNNPEMPLYNFNVSNNNSYIADKYIVHNKGGGGGAPTGVGNPMGYRARGGLIGKPLPGRSRDI